ncbi:hypothetical protein GCM10020001_117320 [Nonomuraea salmonea]
MPASGGGPGQRLVQAGALEQVAVLAAVVVPVAGGVADAGQHGETVAVAVHPQAQARPGAQQRGARQAYRVVLLRHQVGEGVQDVLDGPDLAFRAAGEQVLLQRLAYGLVAVVGHRHQAEEDPGGQLPLVGGERAEGVLGDRAERRIGLLGHVHAPRSAAARVQQPLDARVPAADQGEQEVTGGGAGRRVLVQRGGDQRGQPGRQRAQVGMVRQHAVHDAAEVVGPERVLARRGEHHDRAPREHVGRRARALPGEDLGRHVRGRARHLTGLGERHVLGTRDAEVDHARAVGTDQHVVRLQVAVDDPGLVHGGERGGDGGGEPVQVVAGEPAAPLDDLAQARAGDVLADDVRPRARHVRGQHPSRAERRHPPRRRRLFGEPVAVRCAVDRVQDLERDPPPVAVVGVVDDALAPRAEPPGDPVVPDALRIPGAERFHGVLDVHSADMVPTCPEWRMPFVIRVNHDPRSM